MKICFLALNAYPTISGAPEARVGGAEVQITGIARYLAARGHEVTLVTRDCGQDDDQCIGGVRIIKAFRQSAGLPYLRFFHPRWTGTWSALKRADADVYYQRCAAMETGLLAAYCRANSKKYVFASGSDSDFNPGGYIIPSKRDCRLYEYGLQHANLVVVQTQVQQSLLRKNFGMSSLVIPNGWAWEPDHAQLDHKSGYVLWVSTLRDWKRPGLFLDLAESMPDRRFVMVGGPATGEEDLYEAIRKRASGLTNFEFRGFVRFREIATVFGGASLLVNTSEPKEGFPNTFLQAWQHGVPVISYFDPDSLIKNNELGAVVNSVEELKEMTSMFLSDPDGYVRSSEKVKDFFRRYHHIDATAGQYERAFASLMERGSE